MRAEGISKAGRGKRTLTRTLKRILALIVVLIVLAVLLVPVIVSSEPGSRMILAGINGSIAGKADFADLSMGWFKGINVSDLSFNDDAGRVSVRVERVFTKPAYGSILAGNLALGKTVIDKPRVEVNVEELRGAQTKETDKKQAVSGKSGAIALPIKSMDLVLNDGSVKVNDPKYGSIALSQINSKVDLQPPGRRSEFDLKMVVARAEKTSEIKATGSATTKSKKGWSLKGTSGELTVEVNDLDLESLGPIFALAGVDVQTKGVVAGDIKSQIKDGRIENLTAGVKAVNLDVTGAELKGDRFRTSNLDVDVKLKQDEQTITVDAMKIESDWASVTASGVVPTTLKSMNDFLEADSKSDVKADVNCDLAAVLSQMPKTLGLKEGTAVTSGRLTGNVATVTEAGKRRIRAGATIGGLAATVEGKAAALSESITAEALVSSDKKGIAFDKLEVSAPFARVNCTGRIESLEYDAAVDLAKLQSELGQFVDLGQHKMSGELSSKGQVSVKEDTITVSGASTVKNLLLSSQQGQKVSEPAANIDFSLAVDKKNNFVAIDSINAGAGFGRLTVANGALPLNEKSSRPLAATVSAEKIDLGKLLPFGVMFAALPKEMQLSGIADSTLSITADNGVYEVATDSTRIDGLRLVHPDANKPFESKYVTLAFDTEYHSNSGSANVKSFVLDSPLMKIVKSQFSLSKDGKTTRLSGEADLDYEWSAVSTVAAPFLPEGLTLEGKRRDAVNFHSEYPAAEPNELLPNLSAQSRLGFEKAGYMGLNFGPTDVEIRVQNGVLNISPFTTTVNEGQFSFAGRADFKEKVPLFRTHKPMQIVTNVKVNDEMTGRLLKYVNPIFADAVNVSGFANFNCEQLAIPLKAEAGNDAVVVGTISMNRLRLQGSSLLGQILKTGSGDPRGTDLTIHPTRFALQKGFLRYDDMQIDVGDNPVNFKGVIGLDKSLDMIATLPYTTEGRTARVGRETRGRRIAVPIGGTVDGPQPRMDKMLEDQLKGLVEDQLQKVLDDFFK